MRCDDQIFLGDTELRCQLIAQHWHCHAALALASNAGRHLWQWADRHDVRREPYQADLHAQLPWAEDMPSAEAAII